MTYANDVTGAYAALADLGVDADHVALTLTERGIRGSREVSYACPIARYLEGLFPDCNPEVDSPDVTFHGWTGSDVDDPYEPTRMLAPGPVEDFVDAFDSGAYPHLEVSNG